MTRMIDARVPVLFEPVADAAWLVEAGEADSPIGQAAAISRFSLAVLAHAPGCACCTPHGPVAEALRRLFIGRARGDVPFFTRVVVRASAMGETAVRATLAEDPLISAWFRLG